MRLGTLLGGGHKIQWPLPLTIAKSRLATYLAHSRAASSMAKIFIPAAIAAGAVAVVAAPRAKVVGAVHVADSDPRRAFALIAARYFAPFPETIVAVTRHGKTSTVELTRQLWRMAGLSAASIGALGRDHAGSRVVTGLTTPDIVTFLSNMAGLKREGVTHVAYEASSHGLHQYPRRRAASGSRSLHESQPRSSRLSRRYGSLFHRQAPALFRSDC